MSVDESDAEALGYAAWGNGAPHDCRPFNAETKPAEAAAWQRGWREAEQLMRRAVDGG